MPLTHSLELLASLYLASPSFQFVSPFFVSLTRWTASLSLGSAIVAAQRKAFCSAATVLHHFSCRPRCMQHHPRSFKWADSASGCITKMNTHGHNPHGNRISCRDMSLKASPNVVIHLSSQE
ncbi:hypothetical protein CFOL_v3_20619 [Cephalotus follicularis]|uniref:Uncharacterized protein n=1 Tax=Cephalotus follicularis TaxID=3775 RepID=A0A1Q3CA79_CEPFO|nr:hypothetical protein CFOL_v3_20619 [Cephalotus follicularis]